MEIQKRRSAVFLKYASRLPVIRPFRKLYSTPMLELVVVSHVIFSLPMVRNSGDIVVSLALFKV